MYVYIYVYINELVTKCRHENKFYLANFNPLSASQCCPHIETSQMICCANQLTGFYMRATLTLNGVKTVSRSISNIIDDH